MYTRIRRRVGALALADLVIWLWAVAMLVLAQGALAHTSLLSSTPAAGEILREAPTIVRLSFNETVSPLRIRLIQPDGSTEDITQTKVLPAGLEIPLPTLDQQGAHALSWRVVSADGHPVGGTVTFSVGIEGPGHVVEPARHTVRDFLIWLSRLGGYVGLFLGIGMAVCQAFTAAQGNQHRLAYGLLVLGAGATLLNVGLLGVDALDEPLSALLGLRPWRTAWATSFGLAAALALAALGSAALVWQNATLTLRRMMALVALILLSASLAASGHASNAAPAWLARPAVWLHALVITLWIGSLLPLARSLQDAANPDLLKRFSRRIPLVLILIFASGSTLVYLQFDQPSSLWLTAYGQVLALKLALLVVLLALGAYNRYRLTDAVLHGQLPARRAMRRVIYLECAVAVAILAAVALWRFTPPPRALLDAPATSAQISAHIPGDAAQADLLLTLPDQGQPGKLTLHLLQADQTPLAAQEVDIAFSNQNTGIEPIVLPASKVRDGTWQVSDFELPRLPTWHIRIDALVSDFDRIHLESTLDTRQ